MKISYQSERHVDAQQREHADGLIETEFARALKDRRAQMRVSQAEFAQMVGVQPQTISQWERSAKKPQPRFYERLMALLNVNSRVTLKALIEREADKDGIRVLGARASRPPEHLTLVHDAMLETLAESDSDVAFRSATAIILARNGDLSQTELQIVETLLSHVEKTRPPD